MMERVNVNKEKVKSNNVSRNEIQVGCHRDETFLLERRFTKVLSFIELENIWGFRNSWRERNLMPSW